MDYETLRTEVDGDGIAILTLTGTGRMNAFTVAMANDLEHAFHSLNAMDDVKAIVVTGVGEHFCAGMDLSVGEEPFGLDYTLEPALEDLRDRGTETRILHGVRDTGGRVALAITECLKPVIAAINGTAVGVGATMTLPMDIRLASDNARIGFVFGRIGIVPEACSTWFLPRLIGHQNALELFYAAELIDAERAKSIGLIRSIHAQAALLDEAKALARRFTQHRSPVATALTRQLVYRNSGAPDPHTAHHTESLAIFHIAQSDGREGVRAFREKRTPRFESRVTTDMPNGYPWWD